MTEDDQTDLDPNSFINGVMDGIGAGAVSGWVADSRDYRKRLSVDLVLDGKLFVTITACLFRLDMKTAGYPDAFHGFNVPLPRQCLDGMKHVFEAFVSGTKQHLTKSPMDGIPWNWKARFLSPKEDGRFGPTPLRGPDRNVPRLPRKRKAEFQPSGRSLPSDSFTGVSVIIPSFNRGAQLEATLLKSFECTAGCAVEFIVVDDGSTDDTPQRLARLAAEHPELRYLSIENGGQGRARNLGMDLANYEIVLFQGDDIRPAHSGFYRLHLEAHRRVPHVGVAVLGKVTWPDSPDFELTFTMRHIQGKGQQQFGYYQLMPYTWLDFRFFYTSNVSLKKQVIQNWQQDGFNPKFREYGWEDAELAYRLSENTPGGFGTLYVPAPVATHHHHYNVRQFIERQISTGRAAQLFCRMHPNLRKRIGLDELEAILTSPTTASDFRTPRTELLSMIDGLQAQPCMLESLGTLGQEAWHDDLLRAVFTLSYLQGYIMANEYPLANYDAAYRFLIQRFESDLHQSLVFGVFGQTAPLRAVKPPVSVPS